MKLFKWLTTGVTGLMLVSCVTINIYFPAAAAEKAADRIIEDVWGPEVIQDESTTPEAEEQTLFTVPERNVAITVLNWLISPAEAAEVNIDISSPAIDKLTRQMNARHKSLKKHYTSGAIGLTANGFITIRDAKIIALKERNSVKGLVADENKDRKALYTEIARANGRPEWTADIQSTFARRWVKKAAKGWWYQSGGSWKTK